MFQGYFIYKDILDRRLVYYANCPLNSEKKAEEDRLLPLVICFFTTYTITSHKKTKQKSYEL